MSKRVLLVASETGFADDVRAHARRAGLECDLAVGEMESILAIHAHAPDVVVVCDHPLRRSLLTCDVVVPVARAASIPVLAINMESVREQDVVAHRAGPNRAAQYLRSTAGAEEVVRVASLLARHAMPPTPPPPATRRRDEMMPGVSVGGQRLAMQGGGSAGATARAISIDPAGDVALDGPDRTESGVQAAIRPNGNAQRAVDTKPSALEFEAARREAAEARRVREALERRASEAEQRAYDSERRASASEQREREAHDALDRALREREDSEAGWNARVVSAEQLADQAWKERDAVARTLGEAQRTLESVRGEVAQSRSALERERVKAADYMRERDEARVEIERIRREAQHLVRRVDALEREVDRDRKTAALLDRARERVAALEEDLERLQGERDAALAVIEQLRDEATQAQASAEAAVDEVRASALRAEEAASAAESRNRALEEKIAELGREAARAEAESSAVQTTLRAEIATLEAARAEAAGAAEQLVRAQRVIRHLLDAQQKSRTRRAGSEDANQVTLRLCNRIIETQERRISVLEKITDANHPALQALVAESRRLEKELQILLTQLGRAPTSRH